MNEFFNIIKERPDNSLLYSKVICPFCNSEDVHCYDEISTLAGNNNHYGSYYNCNSCQKKFIREKKLNNVWYTDLKTKQVLKGIPSCFEQYYYTCSKCEGKVYVKHLKLDSDDIVETMLTIFDKKVDKYIKQYRTFYICEKCGLYTESENDFFNSNF